MTKHARRPIRIVGDVAYVPLTRGMEAVVDAEDVPLVSGLLWQAKPGRKPTHTTYAATGMKSVKMHRVIMPAPSGMEVDHIDGDGLNNRKSNLRIATKEQNRRNVAIRPDNTSGYKGVTFDKASGKWQSAIRSDGRQRKLGRYATPEQAHEAYVEASRALHGDYGRIN